MLIYEERESYCGVESALCKLLACFSLSLCVDDTQSEIFLLCYEDEWSRLELSVLVFSRDGCLSGWVIRSRWKQLSYTTQQARPLPIDGRFNSLLIYSNRLEPKCAGFTLLRHAVWRMRRWKKLIHPKGHGQTGRH